jgi:hypothetical protein
MALLSVRFPCPGISERLSGHLKMVRPSWLCVGAGVPACGASYDGAQPDRRPKAGNAES